MTILVAHETKKKDHYHIYCCLGTDKRVIHEERYNTKTEAAKAITKLKRGYEIARDDKGNPLPFKNSLRWEGQSQYGYVESQEEFFIIYGQKHTDQCEQIHNSCEAEAGWKILGWG